MEHIQAKRLYEKKNVISIFTAQFSHDWVLLGDAKFPLGQISTDVLNFDIQMLQNLRMMNDKLFRAASEIFEPQRSLRSDQVTKTQTLFNNTIKFTVELPLYRHLNLDMEELNTILIEPYNKNSSNFERAMKLPNRVRDITLNLILAVCKIPDEMITFSVYTQFMLTDYFESLKNRKPVITLSPCINFFRTTLYRKMWQKFWRGCRVSRTDKRVL